MASFLHKLNRMRNVRMHATNEYQMPHPGLYHEIIQGIPWYGGINRKKPRRLDAGIDRVLTYVIERRPEYKNYPWCTTNNKGVYTHPATFASDRICNLMDLSHDLTLAEAFEIVDKEMDDKKADVDLQVTLAREHAAKLGVVNQGVESLLKRANRVYESVFKMKEEEAVKTRRNVLRDVCRQVQQQGQRLDMQDIIDLIPYRDEQVQFFLDFPEYRKLFPPLWWLSNEVAEVQAEETAKKFEEMTEEESEEEEEEEEAEEEEEDTDAPKKKVVGEDRNFLEEDPDGDAFMEWPPQAMFDRQARNRIKMEEMSLSGTDPEDAELERARAEAKAIIETKRPHLDNRTKNIEIEALAEVLQSEKNEDLFDQLVELKARSDKRPDRHGILESEKSDFYEEFRKFILANHQKPAKERGHFYYGDKPSPETVKDRPLSDAQEIIAKHGDAGGKMTPEAMRELRETIRGRLGDHAASEVFEYAEGGGAVSLAQVGGFSYYDPEEPRHVNLTANLDLSPFYPENAFPPRGLLADPNVDLRDPSTIPPEYEQQYEELVQYGAKYAHAIEDYAPVKSKEYVEEKIRKSAPIVMENMPEKPKLDTTDRAKNLAQVIENQKKSDFKNLEEYESQLTKDGEAESASEQKEEEKEGPMITSEAELQKMKKVALDELAKIAFESDAERKEYELMLERRFEYVAQKRRERNQQWSQYWPADKPETLIYRGPEVIREIFPEAYKLAVTRKFEELSGLPLKEAVEIKSYVGLWKSVRANSHREQVERARREDEEAHQRLVDEAKAAGQAPPPLKLRTVPPPKNVKDLDLTEWQHKISLDPSLYKK